MNAQTSILTSLNSGSVPVTAKHSFKPPGVGVLAQNLLSHYNNLSSVALANASITQWTVNGGTKLGPVAAISEPSGVTEIIYNLGTAGSGATAVQLTLIF